MNSNIDLTTFISRDGVDLLTDSRAVALAFGKQHKNVLRVIHGMAKSARPEIAEHYRLNFEPVDFIDKNGDSRPMFRMTAKGLSELAMSFSGEDARVVRIRFLNAFEVLARRLAHAEAAIAEMLYDLERRELPSMVKGRIGSKLMNERRTEKRNFAEERNSLMERAQPGLFLN